MGGVSEQALAKQGPWPAGVNNVAKEYDLPVDGQTGATIALRSAVNVDIDKNGIPSRRDGYQNVVAAGRAHSLFATLDYLFAVVDGNLVAYDRDMSSAQTIKASVGDRYASFAQANEDVYWSNGVYIQRIDSALGNHPVAVPTPPNPTLTARATGGLEAGQYEVSFTWIDAGGRESGACPPQSIIVTSGGGIEVSSIPAAGEDVVMMRIYCSAPDGEVLYLVGAITPATPVFYIGAHQAGRALETQWLVPMPPGDIIRFWNGRILVASNNMLCWSQALRFGLMHQDSMLRFGARISMMEAVGEGGDGSGVYISDHKRTYFMDGDQPDKWARIIRYPFPAVPGTSLTLPGTAFGLDISAPVAFWLATNGVFCLGLPGGKVQPMTEGRLALPENGEHGTAMFREHKGIRQIVTNFSGSDGNTAGVSDSAAATIRRNGVTIS